MASTRQIPRCDRKKGVPVDLRRAAKNSPNTRAASDLALSELAELLRELHQSLEDYAPMWYTEAMDARIRERLAAAERTCRFRQLVSDLTRPG